MSRKPVGELDTEYIDHRGKFIYRIAYANRKKRDGTLITFIYKRKYYYRKKPRGQYKKTTSI